MARGVRNAAVTGRMPAMDQGGGGVALLGRERVLNPGEEAYGDGAIENGRITADGGEGDSWQRPNHHAEEHLGPLRRQALLEYLSYEITRPSRLCGEAGLRRRFARRLRRHLVRDW